MDGMTLYLIMFYVSWFSVLHPLYFVLHNFRKQSAVMKWFGYALLLSFFCDLFSEIMVVWFKTLPNLGGSIYMLLCPPFFSAFFYRAIGRSSFKIPLIVINVAFTVFWVIDVAVVQRVALQTYTAANLALLVIVLCLCFYYRLLNELPTQRVQRLPLFWIVSGFFLTYSVKFIIYIVTHYLQTAVQDNLLVIWIVHNFFSTVGNVLFGIGAWLSHQQLKST